MPRLLIFAGLTLLATLANTRADLNTLNIYSGQVGLSVDALGSLENPVGAIHANIPESSNILAAYLYSAGTAFPYFQDSPRTLTDYNGAGITLNGAPISFTALVGATSDRPEIGQWFTARADVTGLVNSLRVPGQSSYDWNVTEGALNNRIDGEVLAVVYSDASLPQGSVVLLDGGQRTGGETKNISLGLPLGDPNAPGFVADMSLGISSSLGDLQHSTVDINGVRLTTSAGGFDDGLPSDGALITAGGVGDSNARPALPLSTDSDLDDELYSLKDFVHSGDTSLQIFTKNDSNDDNIFFLGLRLTAPVRQVQDASVSDAGGTLPLLAIGLASLSKFVRRKKG